MLFGLLSIFRPDEFRYGIQFLILAAFLLLSGFLADRRYERVELGRLKLVGNDKIDEIVRKLFETDMNQQDHYES